MDNFMREFARLNLGNKELERLLNTEICIANDSKLPFLNNADEDLEVHPNVLAQPDFQFLPAGMKLRAIEKYKQMIIDQDKTKQAIKLLKGAT